MGTKTLGCKLLLKGNYTSATDIRLLSLGAGLPLWLGTGCFAKIPKAGLETYGGGLQEFPLPGAGNNVLYKAVRTPGPPTSGRGLPQDYAPRNNTTTTNVVKHTIP